MAERALEFEVARKGRPVENGRFNAVADIDDAEALRTILRTWLAGEKWAEARWSEFELRVRPAGAWRFKTTVRA